MWGGLSGAAPHLSQELDLEREKDAPQGRKRLTQSGTASHQPCCPPPSPDGAPGAAPCPKMGSSITCSHWAAWGPGARGSGHLQHLSLRELDPCCHFATTSMKQA